MSFCLNNILSLLSKEKKLEAAGAGIGVVAVVARATETGAARAALGTLGGVLATEEVQSVDDMEHAVARDGVVLRIRAAHRAD